MEMLFGENGAALYLIACLAIISYTNFSDSQRMFLLYLFSFALAASGVFRIRTCLLLLACSTFVFLEYLSEDRRKLELVVKLRYKLLDYFYLMLFQYDFLTLFLSMGLLFLSRRCCARGLLLFLSLLALARAEQWTVAQPFKIKSFTDTARVFDEHPPYMYRHSGELRRRFELLCAFEDRSYFSRSRSYSCVSAEYLRWRLGGRIFSLRAFKALRRFLPELRARLPRVRIDKSGLHVSGRGYSTPEMQLLRTIGIARGYEQYKLRRKIYEVLYSKIFFSSLKDFHQANTFLELEHYRDYILWVYTQNVLTVINGTRCRTFSLAFESGSDVEHWSLEGMFVACLGLCFRPATDAVLDMYYDIICDFGLDREEILRLYKKFPAHKLPLCGAKRVRVSRARVSAS